MSDSYKVWIESLGETRAEAVVIKTYRQDDLGRWEATRYDAVRMALRVRIDLSNDGPITDVMVEDPRGGRSRWVVDLLLRPQIVRHEEGDA